MSKLRLNGNTLRRVIYIVCMIMVFSYIFFDVLDLDGSDFPLAHAPMERTVVVVEVPKDVGYMDLLDQMGSWADISLPLRSMFVESLQLLRARGSKPRPLDAARARGYRAALPRSSTIDPSRSV